MTKDEAVQKLAAVGRLSIAHAEDLYDSFFEKPVVPQYVADWYEENKDEFYLNLHNLAWDLVQNLNHYYLHKNQYMKDVTNNTANNFLETIEPANNDFKSWYYNTKTAFQTLINMHQFGYEVEKKRYRVRLKAHKEKPDYLVMTNANGLRFYTDLYTENREHTRKELESNGYGWVFDCEGIEIEEVE